MLIFCFRVVVRPVMRPKLTPSPYVECHAREEEDGFIIKYAVNWKSHEHNEQSRACVERVRFAHFGLYLHIFCLCRNGQCACRRNAFLWHPKGRLGQSSTVPRRCGCKALPFL